MNIIAIILIVIFVLILFIILIYFLLRQKNKEEEEVEPPIRQPSNVEIIPVDDETKPIVNNIVNNIGIRIAQGPFVITDSEGNLTTSWVNSREWVCQGLRVYSIHFKDLALTVDTVATGENLAPVSLQTYDKNNAAQQFYYTLEKILLVNNRSDYEISLQGLSVLLTNGSAKTYATFTNEDITLETTINFNGTVYPISNLTNARFQPDFTVVNYFTLLPTTTQTFIWNSGLRRITCSFGGVLSLQSEFDDLVQVIYTEANDNDVKKNAIVINGHVYFLGSDPNYCYLLLNNMSAIKLNTASIIEDTAEVPNRITLR